MHARSVGTFERIVTIAAASVLSLAAAAVGVTAVHREFFARTTRVAPTEKPEYIAKWEELIPAGHVIGDVAAPVKLIEFTDLECPFCREFNQTARNVLQRYPGRVAYVFVHRPLAMHRFARSAAQAVECAGNAGKFRESVDLLFAKQDSFGLKSWPSLAREAGVGDTVAFARCMAGGTDSTAFPLLSAGIRVAQRMNVHGTPTVVLNGWRYGPTPSEDELVRAIGDLLAGRRPYPEFPSAK